MGAVQRVNRQSYFVFALELSVFQHEFSIGSSASSKCSVEGVVLCGGWVGRWGG